MRSASRRTAYAVAARRSPSARHTLSVASMARRAREPRAGPGGALTRQEGAHSGQVQQPWYIQVDAGGRIGTSDLLKQLVRVRLPVTTDHKAVCRLLDSGGSAARWALGALFAQQAPRSARTATSVMFRATVFFRLLVNNSPCALACHNNFLHGFFQGGAVGVAGPASAACSALERPVPVHAGPCPRGHHRSAALIRHTAPAPRDAASLPQLSSSRPSPQGRQVPSRFSSYGWDHTLMVRTAEESRDTACPKSRV